MLEPTVFSNKEIINQMKNKYNICITKIEVESRGSANIFYVYDWENNNQKQLLEFAFWRCKMSKTLFNRLDEISAKLVEILDK